MRTSTIATVSTKVTLITSNHNLPLSSTCKVLYFLFSRINNLNRHFLRWHFFQLFAPLQTTPILSHQSLSVCKDGGHREKMYCQRLGTKFIGKTAPGVLSDFESCTMISLKDRFHVFLQMHFSSVFVKLKGSVSFRFEVQCSGQL